jgi:hypothetical protein
VLFLHRSGAAGSPCPKQLSYNQEWQELAYAKKKKKTHLDLHVKQALKLKNQNDYKMAQFLVTSSSTIISKNPLSSALVFT